MTDEGINRRRAAILITDVAGYGRLMEDDRSATVSALEAYRETVTIATEQHRERMPSGQSSRCRSVKQTTTLRA